LTPKRQSSASAQAREEWRAPASPPSIRSAQAHGIDIVQVFTAGLSGALLDDGTVVLVALDEPEVWPGWHDGNIWQHLDAITIADARVTHWMHLPIALGSVLYRPPSIGHEGRI